MKLTHYYPSITFLNNVTKVNKLIRDLESYRLTTKSKNYRIPCIPIDLDTEATL